MAGGAESVQLAERCWVNRWGWQLCCVSAINTRQLGRPAGVSWHRGCGDQGADTGHFREQQRVARARLRSRVPWGAGGGLRLRPSAGAGGAAHQRWPSGKPCNLCVAAKASVASGRDRPPADAQDMPSPRFRSLWVLRDLGEFSH